MPATSDRPFRSLRSHSPSRVRVPFGIANPSQNLDHPLNSPRVDILSSPQFNASFSCLIWGTHRTSPVEHMCHVGSAPSADPLSCGFYGLSQRSLTIFENGIMISALKEVHSHLFREHNLSLGLANLLFYRKIKTCFLNVLNKNTSFNIFCRFWLSGTVYGM